MNIGKKGSTLIILALVITLLIAATGTVAASNSEAVVVLSAAQDSFAKDQDVVIDVTIFNPNKNTIRLLKWFTPQEGIVEPIFAVRSDGQAVKYTGPIFKRPAATGKDYLSLKAGENLVFQVTISDYYDFSKSGDYTIAYNVAAWNLTSEKGSLFKKVDRLSSDTLELKSGGNKGKKPVDPPPPDPGENAFISCDATQEATLVDARAAATGIAADGLAYLTDGLAGPRYTTWFGVYDLARYSHVTSNFTSISDAFVNAGITFNCKCKQPYYAYVYPDKPYVITVCKVFWQVALTGTDSQAGTLVHEMSHFNVVASTDDYVYGQTGAMQLAIEEPDLAVNNADSHEYFAENTPYKP